MIALLAAAFAAPRPEVVELDRVRAEIADQVHLAAFDLVDELVYGWTAQPVFERPTPVVLADVTVPVGLGTGLQAMVENHLADVLSHHPTANLQLVHCPQCMTTVVRSGPAATVVTRGIDDPDVLAELGADTGRHALFLDLEAEGSALVLRARLTRLTPELPIVWSHTIASVAGTPALLRDPTHLKSAGEARDEYLAALRDRGPLTIPLRFAVRTYAQPRPSGSYTCTTVGSTPTYGYPYYTCNYVADPLGTPPPPMVWLQSGVELGATRGGGWVESLLLGYSFIPQAYQGVMAQGRISRLLTGRVRSLTRPDLYLFAGGAVTTVWGPATGSFSNELLDADAILAAAAGDGPRTSFGALQLGLEARLGTRIGFSWFLESLPSFVPSPNIGSYLRIGPIEANSMGTEVTFCF